ncbi:elongation factor P-like protein YeiP [Thalassolituus sp.]|jgi:elongation factor P|uniref:elongation factor P-like protein EfpL n=1 Tax=Thalassolituus sp. TaxID=2030822 RepID=UPI00260BF2A6|nr:elongation factor P-like protein YeiP [uncultured Thalassolituus sp.]TNC92811.1 MAG: elongation factor P-like protein YeiP [Thalassolituus sp.]
MPKASEIKKNAAVEYNGSVYFVKDIERSVPQGRAGGSIYRMRMYDVVTGAKLDESFKDSEMLNLADLTRRPVTLSYIDGEEYNFMDSEDFTMYPLNKDQIEEEAQFITEETQGMQAVVLNDVAVGIDIPTIVELVITETAPAMKGASATSRTKPATLTTGLVVQVPEHIAEGDRIKVNTDECRFTGRAN